MDKLETVGMKKAHEVASEFLNGEVFEEMILKVAYTLYVEDSVVTTVSPFYPDFQCGSHCEDARNEYRDKAYGFLARVMKHKF